MFSDLSNYMICNKKMYSDLGDYTEVRSEYAMGRVQRKLHQRKLPLLAIRYPEAGQDCEQIKLKTNGFKSETITPTPASIRPSIQPFHCPPSFPALYPEPNIQPNWNKNLRPVMRQHIPSKDRQNVKWILRKGRGDTNIANTSIAWSSLACEKTKKITDMLSPTLHTANI